jgi:hypothetical protein
MEQAMTATALIAPEIGVELDINYQDDLVKPLSTTQLSTVTRLSEAFDTSTNVDVWQSDRGHIARLTIDKPRRRPGQYRLTRQDIDVLHSLKERIRWFETDSNAVVVGI